MENSVAYYLNGCCLSKGVWEEAGWQRILPMRIGNAIMWTGDSKLHACGMPAVVHNDGSEEWYRRGVPHREDGPAMSGPATGDKYFIDGVELTLEEFSAIKEVGPRIILYREDRGHFAFVNTFELHLSSASPPEEDIYKFSCQEYLDLLANYSEAAKMGLVGRLMIAENDLTKRDIVNILKSKSIESISSYLDLGQQFWSAIKDPSATADYIHTLSQQRYMWLKSAIEPPKIQAFPESQKIAERTDAPAEANSDSTDVSWLPVGAAALVAVAALLTPKTKSSNLKIKQSESHEVVRE